jgi:hypothetical protein
LSARHRCDINDIIVIVAVALIEVEAGMADLLVRKLDPELVEALKRRAASNGRNAEMEHREIQREL